jgi:hypothetical protein
MRDILKEVAEQCAGGERKRFVCNAMVCEVLSTYKKDIEWAAHYLAPYFDAPDPSQDARDLYRIHSCANSVLFNRVLVALRGRATTMVGSHHRQQTGKVRIDGNLTVYHQPGARMIVARCAGSNTFTILSDGTDEEHQFETARVARELITRELERQGFFLMHAGGVERNGLAYVFCGCKGAGKTTTVLDLLERGYNLLANDRVFIGLGHELGGIRAIGWPGSVAVAVHGLESHRPLGSLATDLGRLRCPQYRLSDRCPFPLVDRTRKLDLTPLEVAAAYGVAVTPSAIVDRIVVLGRDNPSEAYPRRLVRSDSEATLRPHFLFPDDDSYPDRFGLRRSVAELDESFSRVFETLVANVPIASFRTNARPTEKADIVASYARTQMEYLP